MNISGIGFQMDTRAMSSYDRMDQGFGRYDISNQYHPVQADTMEDMSESEISFNVGKAISDMRQDKALEEFQVFVRSGEEPSRQHYQENWMRSMENFALSV